MSNGQTEPHDCIPNLRVLNHDIWLACFTILIYKTTTDICKFPLNYTLLLFHIDINGLLAPTNPTQWNICAEVNASHPR